MKKILCILLSVIMVFCLSGCAQTENPGISDGASDSAESLPEYTGGITAEPEEITPQLDAPLTEQAVSVEDSFGTVESAEIQPAYTGGNTAEPEATAPKSETTTSKPEETTSKPETTTSKPEETTSKPETTPTEGSTPTAEEDSPLQIDENGSYTSRDDVALYIHTYGRLPQNFITKKEAQELGWSGGSLEPYAPGKCIGGSHFGNYEGLLPEKEGRSYTECDIDTLGQKSRGAKRIVFSNDGLIYYTDDHYESFTLLYGEE